MKLKLTIPRNLFIIRFCLLFISLIILGCNEKTPSINQNEKYTISDTLVINISDLQNQTAEDEDTIRKTLHLIESNNAGFDNAKITDGISTIFMRYNYLTRQPEVTISHKK